MGKKSVVSTLDRLILWDSVRLVWLSDWFVSWWRQGEILFGEDVGGTVFLEIFGSYVGLFGSKVDDGCFLDSSRGGLISMARERRLVGPGE